MKAEPPEPDADAQDEELAQLRELVEMQRLKLELHELHQGVQGGNDRSTKRRAAFARERQDGRPLLSQDAENRVGGLLGKTGYKVHSNPLHNTFSIKTTEPNNRRLKTGGDKTLFSASTCINPWR